MKFKINDIIKHDKIYYLEWVIYDVDSQKYIYIMKEKTGKIKGTFKFSKEYAEAHFKLVRG